MLNNIKVFENSITSADRNPECISFLLLNRNSKLMLSIKAFRALIYTLTAEKSSLSSEEYEYLSELYNINLTDGKMANILLHGRG